VHQQQFPEKYGGRKYQCTY